MNCVFCHNEKIRVVKTIKYETCVVRVRFCESCRQAFQTCEERTIPEEKKVTSTDVPI